MRVLLIDADQTAVASIKLALETSNIYVYAIGLGEEGVDLARIHNYDIIVTEMNLPDMSGHRIIRALRNSKTETPILVISKTSDLEDKILSFKLGADDYLSKPFDNEELIVRIQAIVRRFRGYSKSIIEIGEMAINMDRQTVKIGNRPILLSGKEYQVLELLSLRQGIVLTTDKIVDLLYFGTDEPESNVVQVFICKIRRKMGTNDYVHTAPTGKGWYVAYDKTLTQ